MIGRLIKRFWTSAEPKPVEPPRPVAPENCALWNDVMRALDAKPRKAK